MRFRERMLQPARSLYWCFQLFRQFRLFRTKAVGVQRGNAEVGADMDRPGIRRSNPTLRLWFRRTQQGELLSRARFR